MKTIIACRDGDIAEWLQGVLGAAGVKVAVLDRPSPGSPDLVGGDLLIADGEWARELGDAGPSRRMLVVPRGHAIDVSQAIGAGFVDLVVVPASEDEILERVGRAVDQLLRPVAVPPQTKAHSTELRSVVDRVVDALEAAHGLPGTHSVEVMHGMLSVFMMLTDSYESVHRGCPGHAKRTAALVGRIARKVGLADREAGWLELAARVQDIGLVVLHLPLAERGPISLELRKLLNEHPTAAAEILEPLAAWGLPVEAIRQHHERRDGSGYPAAVEGESILQEATILGIADVYEAMTSKRPWRQAASPAAALESIRSGRSFPEWAVDAVEAAVEGSPVSTKVGLGTLLARAV